MQSSGCWWEKLYAGGMCVCVMCSCVWVCGKWKILHLNALSHPFYVAPQAATVSSVKEKLQMIDGFQFYGRGFCEVLQIACQIAKLMWRKIDSDLSFCPLFLLGHRFADGIRRTAV